MSTRILAIAAAALLAPASFAQPGAISGHDAALVETRGLQVNGRNGTYPNGESGLSATVDICNFGSNSINWFAPMNPDHPMYSSMIARDLGDRFEQISDWSYVKHGFASINGGVCGGCVGGPYPGNVLGLNCSDTYGASLNANTFYLGPPAEINPWTGGWNPVGSHFDMGFPPTGSMDGNRSNINVPGGVTFRVRVKDQDMIGGGAFYYGLYVIVPHEPGSAKDNNGVTRRFTPTWTGSNWSFSNNSGSQTVGSMLENWSGAKLASAGNGTDAMGNPINDGKFFVGMKVSGPNAMGLWHYEYAVHNRDNSRGANQFTIPVCPGTVVSNIGFHDIDDNAGNDWAGTQVMDEIVWTAMGGGSLEWNQIYNFSFDADAGPLTDGTVTLTQTRAGAGTPTVDVVIDTPGVQFDTFIGSPCGNPALSLDVSALIPAPTLPNPFFGLGVSGAGAGNTVGFSFSFGNVATDLGGGCVWQLDFASAGVIAGIVADGTGFARLPLPLPGDLSLVGIPMFFQATELVPGGALFGVANLSNALRVNLGNVGPSSCN